MYKRGLLQHTLEFGLCVFLQALALETLSVLCFTEINKERRE